MLTLNLTITLLNAPNKFKYLFLTLTITLLNAPNKFKYLFLSLTINHQILTCLNIHVTLQMTSVAANAKIAKSMEGASKAMKKTNKQMDPMKMNKTMMQFDKESTKMEMTGEMMDDVLNGMSYLFLTLGV